MRHEWSSSLNRLRSFFRLAGLRDDIETRLLAREYRRLLLDDHFDDLIDSELHSQHAELCAEISSPRYRHRR